MVLWRRKVLSFIVWVPTRLTLLNLDTSLILGDKLSVLLPLLLPSVALPQPNLVNSLAIALVKTEVLVRMILFGEHNVLVLLVIGDHTVKISVLAMINLVMWRQDIVFVEMTHVVHSVQVQLLDAKENLILFLVSAIAVMECMERIAREVIPHLVGILLNLKILQGKVMISEGDN